MRERQRVQLMVTLDIISLEREREREREIECSIVPSAFIRVEAFVFVHMLNIYAY